MSETKIRHADPREGFDHAEPHATSITFLAIGAVITLVVVIAALEVYFNHAWQTAVQEKILTAPSEQLQQLRARENAALTTYGYADKQKGVVRIPVDRAMELYLKEAGEGKYFYPTKPAMPKKEEDGSGAVAQEPAKK
jgi:hypothetical protein